LAECLGPGAGLAVGDEGEWGVFPAGQDVVFEFAAVVLFGAFADVQGVEPVVVDVAAEGGSSCSGVDPGSAALLGFDVVGGVVGGLLGGEAGDGGDAVVGFVADPPGVFPAFLGPGHGGSPSDGVGVTGVWTLCFPKRASDSYRKLLCSGEIVSLCGC
jgi:hypothetical protein